MAPTRSGAHPQRASRTRPWVAVLTALGAMTVAFAALMAAQLSGFATNSAPMVVVAGPGVTSADQVAPLTQDQVTHDATDSVTVRLRNDSANPVTVTTSLAGGSAAFSGTLTAALTAEGSIVRSGSLASLTLDAFSLAAHSTTPVTLELDSSTSGLGGLWASSPHLALHVHTR